MSFFACVRRSCLGNKVSKFFFHQSFLALAQGMNFRDVSKFDSTVSEILETNLIQDSGYSSIPDRERFTGWMKRRDDKNEKLFLRHPKPLISHFVCRLCTALQKICSHFQISVNIYVVVSLVLKSKIFLAFPHAFIIETLL